MCAVCIGGLRVPDCGATAVRFRAWQVGLENKCLLPAIGCQEMKHLPAEERREARYRPMKFSFVGLRRRDTGLWRKCDVRDLRLGARDPLENQPSSGAKPPTFLWLAPNRRSQNRKVGGTVLSVCMKYIWARFRVWRR